MKRFLFFSIAIILAGFSTHMVCNEPFVADPEKARAYLTHVITPDDFNNGFPIRSLSIYKNRLYLGGEPIRVLDREFNLVRKFSLILNKKISDHYGIEATSGFYEQMIIHDDKILMTYSYMPSTKDSRYLILVQTDLFGKNPIFVTDFNRLQTPERITN